MTLALAEIVAPSTVLAYARIGNPALGWIIPGVVFLISFVLTWMIYRHFSRRM